MMSVYHLLNKAALRVALFAASLLLLAPAYAADQDTVAVFDFELGHSVQLNTKLRDEDGSMTLSLERSRQTNQLTNRLINELVNAGDIKVVEREQIRRIMDEADFSRSALSDPNSAMKIGKMLGADYMIFGAITQVQPSIHVQQLPYNAGTQRTISMDLRANARLVKTATGVVEASTDAKVTKSTRTIDPSDNSYRLSRSFQQDAYSDLAAKMAKQLLGSVNPTKVARQQGKQVYLTGKLPVGSQCKVIAQGEVIKDPSSGEVLGRTEQPKALVEITHGMKKLSKAKVVKWLDDSKHLDVGALCRPLET